MGSSPPATRFPVKTGPFVNSLGLEIAFDWDDLKDGTLNRAVNVTSTLRFSGILEEFFDECAVAGKGRDVVVSGTLDRVEVDMGAELGQTLGV